MISPIISWGGKAKIIILCEQRIYPFYQVTEKIIVIFSIRLKFLLEEKSTTEVSGKFINVCIYLFKLFKKMGCPKTSKICWGQNEDKIIFPYQVRS